MTSAQRLARHVAAGAVLIALSASPAIAQQEKAAAKSADKAEKSAPARVATVNGKPIPKSRVDTIVRQQAGRGVQDNEQLRKAVVERLVNFELVVQDAERKGLTRSVELQTQLDMARQQVIFNAYVDDYFKAHPIKDDALRAEYTKVRSQRGDKEFKARHILVEKEAEAREILDKLAKGEKFEELAKASRDPGSKDRGGELDWASPGTFVKPFADALSRLDKGKTTDTPVQSQFGFHIIRLDDVRAAPFPSFEQAKGQIQQYIQEQELQKVFSDLRAKAKIE